MRSVINGQVHTKWQCKLASNIPSAFPYDRNYREAVEANSLFTFVFFFFLDFNACIRLQTLTNLYFHCEFLAEKCSLQLFFKCSLRVANNNKKNAPKVKHSACVQSIEAWIAVPKSQRSNVLRHYAVLEFSATFYRSNPSNLCDKNYIFDSELMKITANLYSRSTNTFR